MRPRLPTPHPVAWLFLLTALLSPVRGLAEYEELPEPTEPESQLLKPRNRPRQTPDPKVEAKEKEGRIRLPSRWAQPGISLLATATAFRENTFDRRFGAFGLDGFFSGSLGKLGDLGHLHLEAGVGMMFSRFSLPPSGETFTHIYFRLPVRLRLIMPVGRKFAVEGIAGALWRFAEYDSRPTTDGGLSFAREPFKSIDPNVGLGLLYSASPGLRLRFCLEYLNLAVGVEFQL